MLRTYFLQKFRKASPYLVVFQLVVLAFCLYLMQNQQQRLSSLETQLSSYIEKDNLQWEEVVEGKLRDFESAVNRTHFGFAHLERGNGMVDLLQEYQDTIEGCKLTKQNCTNKQLKSLFLDFQKEAKNKLYHSNLQYPRIDTADMRFIERELKLSKNKMDILNQENSQFSSPLLKLNILENVLLTFTETIIDFLKNRIICCDSVYDKYYAHVIPNAETIEVGETFEADIFLDMKSSMIRPRIFLGEEPMRLDEDGIAHYQVKTTEVGTQKILIITFCCAVYTGVYLQKGQGFPTNYPHISFY